MRCPFCNHHDTSVKDSRTTDDHTSIRRRRVCLECGSRFTTFERVCLRDLVVIKKDGRRVPFDREKLVSAVSSAMHKHTMDIQKTERIVSSIVRQFETAGEIEISSRAIGETVMQLLANIDPVAYVRFASIYKEFDNIQDFVDLISSIDTQEVLDHCSIE